LEALRDLVEWIPLGLPAFAFVITLVVFFHELGHFSVARACGVGVETFSIGFGPAIVSWKDRKGTQWKISWIPLGGYVKFLGDADASSRPDEELVRSLPPEERSHAFLTKPLWQRAAVVTAGPAANFVLAILIFAATFVIFGREIVIPRVDQVQPHSAAAAAGIKPGDIIKRADGATISEFSDLQSVVTMSAGRDLPIVVERQGKLLTLHATPKLLEVKTGFGDVQRVGVLGIVNNLDRSEVRLVRYGVPGALREATIRTWDIVHSTMTYLWRMVVGQQDASQLSGPLGIAKVSRQVASIGIIELINLAALISVSIGLVNLFPVPILDGGHLLYYACEAIRGRPLGARAQDVGFRLGLAVMVGLMVLATWNDLLRLNLF
jgi:regulator of sigma E protease